MITFIAPFAEGIGLTCAGAAVLLLLGYGALLLADRLTEHHGRHETRVIPGYDDEPGDEWAEQLHQIGDDTRGRMAAIDVTGPVASAPDAPQAGPVTTIQGNGDQFRAVELHRLHAVEVHPVQHMPAVNAATPLWADGENKRAGNWPMGDRDQFTESAWTKRSALDLAIQLAEDALDAGFDHIVDYATSGIQARWTEVA